MKRRILIAMLLFASAALAQSDPWAALRVFEGKWEGTVTGKPGKQVSHREYHFEYNDKFLSQRDDSVYQPQSSSDRSGNRGDFGVFSYDVIHRGAYETMAEHFALLVDGHQGSKVESTKKLLALVQETSGLGETPWADRDIGVQVSSTIMCFPSDWWSALGHASFCRCPPQFPCSQAHIRT